jgi:hypothetical protein
MMSRSTAYGILVLLLIAGFTACFLLGYLFHVEEHAPLAWWWLVVLFMSACVVICLKVSAFVFGDVGDE